MFFTSCGARKGTRSSAQESALKPLACVSPLAWTVASRLRFLRKPSTLNKDNLAPLILDHKHWRCCAPDF